MFNGVSLMLAAIIFVIFPSSVLIEPLVINDKDDGAIIRKGEVE